MSAYALQFLPGASSKSKKGELHPSVHVNGTKVNATQNCSASSTSETSQQEQQQQQLRNSGSGSGCGWYSSSNDLFISIISASVDPIQLIQAFTAPRKHVHVPIQIPVNHSGIRETIASISNTLTSGMNHLSISPADSDENWGEYCDSDDSLDLDGNGNDNDNEWCDSEPTPVPVPAPQSSSTTFSRTALPMRNESDTGTDTRTSTSAGAAPHDDAIQFTMSISFNGRKYNATRALPSFVKLRDDLMTELSNIKNLREHRRNRRRRHSNSQRSYSSNKGQGHGQGQDQAFFHYKQNDEYIYIQEQQEDSDEMEQEPEVIIPELPIGGNKSRSKLEGLEHGAMAMVGMVGSGFRGLQATVCSYKPQMECWIQSVAALVPSSPTLANFLWEPIHNDEGGCGGAGGCGSSSTNNGSRNDDDDYDNHASSSSFQSNKKQSMQRRRSSVRFSRSRNSLLTLNSIHEASDDESECSSVVHGNSESIGCNLSFEDDYKS